MDFTASENSVQAQELTAFSEGRRRKGAVRAGCLEEVDTGISVLKFLTGMSAAQRGLDSVRGKVILYMGGPSFPCFRQYGDWRERHGPSSPRQIFPLTYIGCVTFNRD